MSLRDIHILNQIFFLKRPDVKMNTVFLIFIGWWVMFDQLLVFRVEQRDMVLLQWPYVYEVQALVCLVIPI